MTEPRLAASVQIKRKGSASLASSRPSGARCLGSLKNHLQSSEVRLRTTSFRRSPKYREKVDTVPSMSGNGSGARQELGEYPTSRRSRSSNGSLAWDRQKVATHLSDRRKEIDDAVIARVEGVAGGTPVPDPEYLQGLRAAVSSAIGYAIASIESGQAFAPRVPVLVLSQARSAARHGIQVELVMERCSVGHILLSQFLAEAIEANEPSHQAGLSVQLQTLALAYAQLKQEVKREYAREQREIAILEPSRNGLVRRLLAGEKAAASDLAYDLNWIHVGAIARGPEAESVVKAIAVALDCHLLLVRQADETIWSWLGRRAAPDLGRLSRYDARQYSSTSLAVGECSSGIKGWRQTHSQAKAAFLIALREPGRIVRYAEEPLTSTLLHDDLLQAVLREHYLTPLEKDGDKLLGTLRAYFAANRNGASAAEALNVSRQTVSNHLLMVERCLGRPLPACSAELEIALRLEELLCA